MTRSTVYLGSVCNCPGFSRALHISHLQTKRFKSFSSVCVCAPCSHRDSFELFFHVQGVVARQRVYHQRRHSLSLGDTGTDHPSVPATMFKVCGSHARYAVTCRFVFDLSFWPLLRLKTSRLLGGSLDLSGFGFLRLACGTAISSVCISISVFGLAPTRDEPAECLPWTRRTGVCRTYPLPGYRAAHSGRRWLMPQELGCLSHLWNSKLAHAFT